MDQISVKAALGSFCLGLVAGAFAASTAFRFLAMAEGRSTYPKPNIKHTKLRNASENEVEC